MSTNHNGDGALNGGNLNQGRNGGSKLPAASGISLPATERLRGRENYTSWAFATKMLLIREGTWDAVTRGDGDADPVDTISLRALATICLSIEPVNYSLVQSAETAKAAWTNLKNAFQDDEITRRIGLLRKLTSIRLSKCSSVKEYVSQTMSTSHKLSPYIPDLALNLLSVSKICKNGYRVVFTKDACEVRSQSNELVAVGREAEGLYKLCLANRQASYAAKEADDMVLWYRRMGHLYHQSLKQLRDMATGSVGKKSKFQKSSQAAYQQ